MKKVFLICVLFLLATFAFGFNVVRNGKSDCVIVIAKDANPAEKYAASEFQKYIKQSSGVELAITTTPQKKNNIFIETKKDIQSDWDTVNISADVKNMYLKGDNDRGTIYSVYEFLEKYVGVRFFNDDRIIVPQKNTIKCPNKKYTYTPSFMIRDTSDVSCTNKPFGVCTRFNSNHLPYKAEWGYRLALAGCHTLKVYLPISKYGKTHPDFYAMRDGSRYITDETQPCFSNLEMRKELAKIVIDRISKNGDKAVIDVSQNDNLLFCECDECKAKIEKYGACSGVLLECINYIADEVKKVYPNTKVETLAYNQTRKAPVGIVPRDNVIIRLCSIECNFAEPIGLKDKNAPYKRINCYDFKNGSVDEANIRFDKDLTDWSKICKNLFIWDYIVNFHNCFIPHPNFQVLKPNLEYFHKHNVMGVYGESNRDNYNSSFDELRNYIEAKLLWDLSLDPKALTKEFCDGVYGAGSEDIQKCIDIFTNIFIRDHYYCSTYVEDMNWMSDKEIIDSINLYKSALEKTKDDAYCNDRINTLYMSFLAGWYLLPDDRFETIKKECNLPWNTKKEFWKEFVNYNEARGNTHWKEHVPFDTTKKAIEFRKVGPVPECCKNLKDDEWYTINNVEINLSAKWGGKVLDDPTSSEGLIACLKNNGDWGAHFDLSGNIAKDKKAGYNGYDVYARIKAIGKKGNEGEGFRMGFYDYDLNKRLFRETVPLSKIGEDWTEIYLGKFTFNDSGQVEPYFVGCKNDNFEWIGVDKIILIKK